MTMSNEYCDHCGAKLEKTRVSITRTLAKTLIKLRRLESELGKPQIWLDHDDVNSEHRLTRSQRNNMTRLRWLGLARYTESHSGTWFITSKGYKFLRGEPVKCEVWTFRNKIIEEMRNDKVTTLAEVFRGEDVPYYEPATDRAPATQQEKETAVETKYTTVNCDLDGCKNMLRLPMIFGQPLVGPFFCSLEHKDQYRRQR